MEAPKIVCKFESIQFVNWEQVDDKFRLMFAPEIFSSNSKKCMAPADVADFHGGVWKAKVDQSTLNQYRPILKQGGFYNIKAALDSWYGDNRKSGVWFQIISIEVVP